MEQPAKLDLQEGAKIKKQVRVDAERACEGPSSPEIYGLVKLHLTEREEDSQQLLPRHLRHQHLGATEQR